MNVLKIAAVVVLGLLCWNLLVAWSEEQERVERQEQLRKALNTATENCDEDNTEACNEMLRLSGLELEQANEELRSLSP